MSISTDNSIEYKIGLRFFTWASR